MRGEDATLLLSLMKSASERPFTKRFSTLHAATTVSFPRPIVKAMPVPVMPSEVVSSMYAQL